MARMFVVTVNFDLFKDFFGALLPYITEDSCKDDKKMRKEKEEE